MKKILLAIVLGILPALVLAAQTPVTPIGSFANPAQTSINTLRDATDVKIGVIEANRLDHETRVAVMETGKAAVSCFADSAAFNACFALDWPTGFDTAGDYIVTGEWDFTGATVTGISSGGITHATSDGAYYASKDGAWANLSGVFLTPTGSAAGLTNFPTLNQNTTGTAAGLTAQYINWESATGGNSIANKPPLGTASALNVGTSANNVVQLNSSGALPAVSGANLTNLPSASLPTWLPSTAPTNGRQIMQAIGGCSVETYDTQATCEANAGTWTSPVYVNTSVLSGLINDAGVAADDLLSAAKIITMLAVKQNLLVADTDYLTPDTASSTYQVDLAVPDQAEAEGGIATTERAWTAQRVAQAIVALAPGGVDEIVYQADCSTITNGFCIDTDDGAPWYWNGTAAIVISGGTVDLTAPGPIGSVAPDTGNFTTLSATAFDTSAPAPGETGEIGFLEDPANGTDTITLKAPADLASDVILTLPAGVAPASATATGTPGQWWYDANYWYVCIATNTWVRAPLETW